MIRCKTRFFHATLAGSAQICIIIGIKMRGIFRNTLATAVALPPVEPPAEVVIKLKIIFPYRLREWHIKEYRVYGPPRWQRSNTYVSRRRYARRPSQPPPPTNAQQLSERGGLCHSRVCASSADLNLISQRAAKYSTHDTTRGANEIYGNSALFRPPTQPRIRFVSRVIFNTARHIRLYVIPLCKCTRWRIFTIFRNKTKNNIREMYKCQMFD